MIISHHIAPAIRCTVPVATPNYPKQAQETMKRFPDKKVTARTMTMNPSATLVEMIRRFVTSISMAERVRDSALVRSRIGRTASMSRRLQTCLVPGSPLRPSRETLPGEWFSWSSP
jgi:hypothetical protein